MPGTDAMHAKFHEYSADLSQMKITGLRVTLSTYRSKTGLVDRWLLSRNLQGDH